MAAMKKIKEQLSAPEKGGESLWADLSNCLEHGGKKLTDSAIALNKRFECRH